MTQVFAAVGVRAHRLICLAVVVLLPSAAARADTINIFPSRDTTLFSDLPRNSDGAGPSMFVGANRTSGLRRGLLDFDIAANLPAGTTITSVQLTLFQEVVAPAEKNARPIELHRLLADWGEGTTGKGSSSTRTGKGFTTPADGTAATWSHRFYSTETWTAPGGDFLATASGSTMVGTARQAYVWDSTAAMVADVQSWLDDPASNFGWILLGDESVGSTARRFDSREASNSALRPMLTITFSGSAVPERSTLSVLAFGSLGIMGYLWRRQKRGGLMIHRPAQRGSGPPV